jgi:hypothetical protein
MSKTQSGHRLVRSVVEQHTFSKEDLAELAKSSAKLQIIGTIYRGDFGEQTTRWNEDGSLTVLTTHTPSASSLPYTR